VTCTIAGCEKAARRRGWCTAHYTRWRRHGDPLGGALPRGLDRESYFWAKVEKKGHLGCWVWTGAINPKGYGTFNTGETTTTAHRYAYELLVGPVPEEMQLDHICRVRACVRPTHLEVVTQSENVMRGKSFAVTNAQKVYCDHGHALTPDNSYGYKSRRQCIQCAQDAARKQSADPEVKARRRDAYRRNREAGMSPKEAARKRGG
jgi:hypothetical protein